MNREERSKFVSGFSKVLTQSWADESYRKRLHDDPVAVLREAGVTVPDGVTVNIKTEISGDGDLEGQIKLWEAGLKSGSADLYVPSTPQLADGELSDSQLEAVAGGGDCCCTCTPTCCCT
jgi:hypothetical protein